MNNGALHCYIMLYSIILYYGIVSKFDCVAVYYISGRLTPIGPSQDYCIVSWSEGLPERDMESLRMMGSGLAFEGVCLELT